MHTSGKWKFLYRSVVVKVQSPEALFSLRVVPVVSFATPKSKERIKASVSWNVSTLEKPKMPLKVDKNKSCMLTAILGVCSVVCTYSKLLLHSFYKMN